MYNKYFTVEVKPDIDADLIETAIASDDDLMWSWWPFEVPKGSSRLLNVTATVAGNDGTAQHLPFQLIFAKSKIHPSTGVMYNPTSLGEWNETATFLPSKNEAIGSVKIDTVDYLCQSLVGASLASTGNSVTDSGSSCDLVLTPAGTDHASYTLDATNILGTTGDIVTITPGYDILWVAGIGCGAMDFSSTVQSDIGETYSAGVTTIHTDTKSAHLLFTVGDVIQDEDNNVLGEIKSLGTAATHDVDINLVSKTTTALANAKKIYHRNPITLELSFEK